jgi:hypothetical protein
MTGVTTIKDYANYMQTLRCMIDIPEDVLYAKELIFEIWTEKLFTLYPYEHEHAANILQRAYEIYLR